jgi:cytochrome b6
MRFFKRPLIIFLIPVLVLTAAGLLVGLVSIGQASSPSTEITPQDWQAIHSTALSIDLAETGAGANQPAFSIPVPQQDTCLHCHITGEDKSIWTPLGRWLLFGTAGMFLAFGVYRQASIWVNRSPWKPLSYRAAGWVDERYEISEPLTKVLSKPVPKYALRWFYCLGGITAFLFIVQAATGIMLAFYYQPTPEAAYASIQFIENEVRFGASIRAIHHWAANGMIVMVVAHMIRVFVMGAFKAPRELNWVSGVLLFLLTVCFGFTGYLLPWDQRAYWATTVGSEIAGAVPVVGDLMLVFMRVGWTVSELTLTRFYALHVIALPILTILFMVVHFLMIRRTGIARPL